MAQIQKEEVKQKLLTAASQHFVLYGIKQASMRAIALDANVTVGNVYRYFQNKDDLALAILEQPLKLLSQALLIESKPLNNKNSTYQDLLDSVNKQIDTLVESLLNLYMLHQQACIILLNEEKYYQLVQQWLLEAMRQIVTQWQLEDKGHPQATKQLTKLIAVAILSGIKVGFNDALKQQLEVEQLQYILKKYLSLYQTMLMAGK